MIGVRFKQSETLSKALNGVDGVRETSESPCIQRCEESGAPLIKDGVNADTMATTIYVMGFDPDQNAWIETALGRSVDAVVHVNDGHAWLASAPNGPGHCLIASADVDGAATLSLVRALRAQGNTLPVIVLGPHTEFRTAVDIARLAATDFLERPVSVRNLRAAVRRVRSESH